MRYSFPCLECSETTYDQLKVGQYHQSSLSGKTNAQKYHLILFIIQLSYTLANLIF